MKRHYATKANDITHKKLKLQLDRISLTFSNERFENEPVSRLLNLKIFSSQRIDATQKIGVGRGDFDNWAKEFKERFTSSCGCENQAVLGSDRFVLLFKVSLLTKTAYVRSVNLIYQHIGDNDLSETITDVIRHGPYKESFSISQAGQSGSQV